MKVADAYENLERIVTYGFLSARVSFMGHDLLIKNISDKEYRQLGMLCSSKTRIKSNVLSLVYSTAFVDGINLMEYRDEHLKSIVRFYGGAPSLFVVKVVDILNELNQTYIDSLEYLEGFCYSHKSRYLWSVLDPYDRSSFVGMRGLDRVGINSVLENWISINKKLDEEQEYTKNLNLTLLVVGASNHKSAKMISQNHDKHIQELKELREEICKYGFDRKRVQENDKKRETWTAPLNSREDLVRELYRQMSGDKDRHDLYIDEWVRTQKERAEAAKANVEEKQREFREKIESTDMGMLEASRPISQEEMSKRISASANKMTETFMAGTESMEIKERAFKKLSMRVIRPDIKDKDHGPA